MDILGEEPTIRDELWLVTCMSHGS